ncbi:MAG: hypothetical protein D6758_09810 [Gammaproteobacteria bacterium]|nr:MAG: hypothetical protein D6758_09810 [Gammaproteobacteria bacterium]
MSSRSLYAALERLTRAENGRLAASSLTKAQQRALDELARTTGAVSFIRQGRGCVYEVRDPEVLDIWWRRLCPSDPGDLPADMPDRAANVAIRRDSKGGQHKHEHAYLLLKASGAPVSWSDDRAILGLTQATRDFGVAALAIHPEDAWISDQPLWLIENQALFDRTDWLEHNGPVTLCYYGGQLSGRLLAWLAHRPRAPEIVLFADYDGIGLMNYCRLLAQGGDGARFYLMADWQAKLGRFGNPDLWQRTREDFARAAALLPEGDAYAPVRALMVAMQRLGKALEQEAIWLSPVEDQADDPD